MLKRCRSVLVLIGLLLMPAGYARAADSNSYLGAGLGVFGLAENGPGISQADSVFGGFLKGGLEINDYLGVEVRIGSTVKGVRDNAAGTFGYPAPFTTSIQAESFISYLAKLRYPLMPAFRPYALLGATTARFKSTLLISGVHTSTVNTVTGLSYGIGGDYAIDERFSAGAEWVQYWNGVTTTPNTKARFWGATAFLHIYF
ncbi:MAG TPA: porin family protein [Mariprofundaceae bacterium]|nr:porin family protein [Mariprofundaceae bacterium]